jgi:hypothetical protein
MKVKKGPPDKAVVRQSATSPDKPKPAPRSQRRPLATAKAAPATVSRQPGPARPASRRRAKAAVELPAPLLEGDLPALPPVSGPGQRYALGPVAPPLHSGAADEAGELPEAYGTKRLLLTARDPHWLYAHWDLTTQQLRTYNTLSADRHLVLRVFIEALGESACAEVHVHPESRNWFVHVGRGGTKYLAQLGYYAKTGRRWVTISTADATLTPPDAVSPDTTVQFATIPVGVPFEVLVALVKAAALEHVPLAEAILQLRLAGVPGLPEPERWPSSPWTPEQERALAAVISMDSVRRVWIGSLEITELLRRKLFEQAGSAAVAQFGVPTSPAGALGSVSSPFGGAARAKGFWFIVNAELILYGATEPDATVTLGGRQIKLRPDGSFSYRFALPDGHFELPASAVSAEGDDRRTAALEFTRTTAYAGEIGVHPQDAKLKAPLATNVA